MPLLSKSPREVLYDMIQNANSTAPLELNKDTLYLGRPHQDSADYRKTILPCVAVLAGGYEGYVTFEYKRINLGEIFGRNNEIIPAITSAGAQTLYEMLPIINQLFGLNFAEEDVQNVDLSGIGTGTQVNVRVISKSTSPGYVGEFAFKFTRIRPTFATVIAQVNLNARNHYKTPDAANKPLEMFMWDFDFTPYKDILTTQFGQWTQYGALYALMRDTFGLDGWPQAGLFKLANYATSQGARFNQKYDRVFVQPDVVIGDKRGYAYLHYNNVLS